MEKTTNEERQAQLYTEDIQMLNREWVGSLKESESKMRKV